MPQAVVQPGVRLWIIQSSRWPAAARGIDEQELIRRILAKAEAFAALSGTIIGQRQALEDQVRAGELGVVWPDESM